MILDLDYLFSSGDSKYILDDPLFKDFDEESLLKYILNYLDISDDSIESDSGSEVLLKHPEYNYLISLSVKKDKDPYKFIISSNIVG